MILNHSFVCLILICILGSCSGKNISKDADRARTLASRSDVEIPDELREEANDLIDHTDKILAVFQAVIDRYERGQNLLAHFDADLDRVSNLRKYFRTSQTYHELIALRMGHKRDHDLIRAFFSEVLRRVTHLDHPEAALSAVKDFGYHLKSLTEDESQSARVARFALFEIAQVSERTFQDWTNKLQETGLFKDLSQLLNGLRFERLTNRVKQEIEELETAQRPSLDLKLIEVAAGPHSGTLFDVPKKVHAQNGRELARLEKRLQKSMAEAFSDEADRQLAAGMQKVFPDAGSHGNIFGGGPDWEDNTWALTFDDGPDPTYSPMILSSLKGHGYKATFFTLAERVDEYPDTYISERDSGMAYGCHSWSHLNLVETNSARTLHHEIGEAKRFEESVLNTGIPSNKKLEIQFYRCPYGACIAPKSPHVRKLIADQGMIHVYWSIDSVDFNDRNPQTIIARIKKQTVAARKGIILMHDIYPWSASAAKLLLNEFKHSNARLVTIPEVRDMYNGIQKDTDRQQNHQP